MVTEYDDVYIRINFRKGSRSIDSRSWEIKRAGMTNEQIYDFFVGLPPYDDALAFDSVQVYIDDLEWGPDGVHAEPG